MEVFNFLHLTARRLAAMVVVMLMASLTTAFVLSDEGESYEAEVLVFVGQALPPDRSTFAVTPFVGDLEVMISLEPVQNEIAAASGIDEIATVELATRQVDNGTALSIRAVADTPELAETVAAEAARVGLTTLLEQERDRAQRGLDAAEFRLLDARADLDDFRTENDTQNPTADYELAVEELSSVQVQLLNADLSTGVLQALEERQQELVERIGLLAPLQVAFSELDRAAVDAERAVSDASRELSTTEALLTGAASGDFLVATPAAPVSSRETVIAGMVATAFVVVVLSIGLFTLIDSRRDRRSAPEVTAIDAGRSDQQGRPRRNVSAAVAAEPSWVRRPPGSPQTVTDPEDGELVEGADRAAGDDADDDDDDKQFVCVCGTVCRSGAGLSSHQRACEDHLATSADQDAAGGRLVTDQVDVTEDADVDHDADMVGEGDHADDVETADQDDADVAAAGTEIDATEDTTDIGAEVEDGVAENGTGDDPTRSDGAAVDDSPDRGRSDADDEPVVRSRLRSA